MTRGCIEMNMYVPKNIFWKVYLVTRDVVC